MTFNCSEVKSIIRGWAKNKHRKHINQCVRGSTTTMLASPRPSFTHVDHALPYTKAPGSKPPPSLPFPFTCLIWLHQTQDSRGPSLLHHRHPPSSSSTSSSSSIPSSSSFFPSSSFFSHPHPAYDGNPRPASSQHQHQQHQQQHPHQRWQQAGRLPPLSLFVPSGLYSHP